MSIPANFLWTAAGNGVYALCQWAMLVILARISTPEIVGQFALGLAITAPVILFTNLSLRAIQATDARREFLFGHCLALRILSVPASFLVILGIVLLGRHPEEAGWVILLMGLAKGVEALGDVFYGLFQQRERMDRMSVSMILKGILGVTGLSVGFACTHQLVWGVAGLGISWALVGLLYDLPSARFVLRSQPASGLRPVWDRQSLIRLVGRAFPLGVAALLVSLTFNIPRYFIEGLGGERALGFFAAIFSLLLAGTTVVNALGQSASPRWAQYHLKGECRDFWRLLFKVLGLAVVLGLAGILIVFLAGRQILSFIYGEDYARLSNVLMALSFVAPLGFVASILGFAMTAAQCRRIQPLIFAASVLITASLCWIWVPQQGLMGATWAMGASAGFQALAAGACVWRAVKR